MNTKLSIVASAMAMLGMNKDINKGFNVFQALQIIADSAKPKGMRSSIKSHPSAQTVKRKQRDDGAHSMRCQFRIKGNTIMADGRHKLYMKNGVVTSRESL